MRAELFEEPLLQIGQRELAGIGVAETRVDLLLSYEQVLAKREPEHV